VQQNHGSVALTGGTGFIGQHLIDALAREGWRVKALTRHPGGLPENDKIQQVTGILEDPSALRELVTDVQAVIHAGGRITARNLNEFESSNVLGTENLIRAAVEQPNPPTVIYISTIAAREPHLSHYAATKREGETRLRNIGESLDWQIIRPPVVYGPGDKQTLKLFRQFKSGFALELGSGGRFSMIYVDDLISAILYVLNDFAQNSNIYELDDGHQNGYSWSEVVDEASRKLKRRVTNIAVPRGVQHLIAASGTIASAISKKPPILSRGKINEFAHTDWVAKSNLLSDFTDWQSNINLREGISRTIDWYVSHGWL
jgi:nucleoside-diphosphate-sugar epimerase